MARPIYRFKILTHMNTSCNGGNYQWIPGVWTKPVKPVICLKGYHVITANGLMTWDVLNPLKNVWLAQVRGQQRNTQKYISNRGWLWSRAGLEYKEAWEQARIVKRLRIPDTLLNNFWFQQLGRESPSLIHLLLCDYWNIKLRDVPDYLMSDYRRWKESPMGKDVIGRIKLKW